MSGETAALLAKIPYLDPLHVAVVAEGEEGVTVSAPFGPEVANYAGSFHAGALFTLAETAAGTAAHRLTADLGGFVLLRGATVRYTKRAVGAISATAKALPKDREALRRGFTDSGRADADVAVTITGPEGLVFEGTFDYAMRRRTP